MANNIVPSIIKSYKGKNIRINPQTRYVCLTDMASASGKLFGHWCELKGTQEYLTAFSEAIGITIETLLHVGEGSTGTWAHQKIAIRFAQWCSPEFAIQVDFWIDELLTTGKVELTPEHEPQYQRKLAPQRDLLDYWDAAKEMGISDDPILRSLFSQRMAEQLGGKALPETQEVILTVRAQELGYSQKDIGNGSALGLFVKKQGLLSTGKTYHGKYKVNTYELSEELDRAISLYFS